VTRLNERIETALPIEEAFAYLADFANSEEWDPGVASAERLDEGPVGVGARYRVGVRQGDRIADMEYRISVHEPSSRVVLIGSGSGISAVDDIRFERAGRGSVVTYTADIKLNGLLRLVQPFLGGTFAKIARDAADGIERTLNARAAAAGGDVRP
jgi:carbon monoxide dehydrogenase subunit G